MTSTDISNPQQNPQQNPLLKPSQLPHGAVNFPEIQPEHYLPSLREAIVRAKQEISAIKDNPLSPNFENTIEALEISGEWVGTIGGIYFNLFGAEANDAHQALAEEVSALLAEYGSDVSLDPQLFARVQKVYDQREQFDLNTEQKQLLRKTYKSFVRNGALLSADDREKLRSIDRELAQLNPRFAENLLKSTNLFILEISKESDLAGLPESTIEAMREAAIEKGLPNSWVVTLQAPLYVPFLTYADNHQLREQVWRAFAQRATEGEFSNKKIMTQIALLRQDRAHLLGYKTHAHYVLEERMAETPQKVHEFLQRLLQAVKPAAEKEIADLAEFKHQLTGERELKPWDVAYYSEKLKKSRFAFDEEELRPYFALEKVIHGVFSVAEKLYGLKFTETNLPVYHGDVKVYEVSDKSDSRVVGLFYTDFFPRTTKKSGAWMTTYRDQGLLRGKVERPHVSIVCNFTKPTPSKPSLLTLDEVRTLFHEFGHALHALLSDCTYTSVAGTNVYWDFVELPSQIMENWVLEKEALDLFAHHYQSGAAIPIELTEKIRDTAQFMAGYTALRQLRFAYLDMAWHDQDPQLVRDVDDFERKVLEDFTLLPTEPGTNVSCSFAHIFAGGYSAGYYSYKWAEVLDADAFQLFKEKGLFNAEVANRFRSHILARGGTEHPMDLYVRFRGREPDPDALLRRDGLI